MRYDEVQSGVITHAIRMTAEATDTSYLWPARHEAGTSSNPDLPPMGARFRLKASYDISGYSPQAQVVLRAMQHYGLILADNGSNWYFGGTADRQLARRAGQRAQGGAGQRLRGGRRVVADDRSQLGPGPPARRRRSTALRSGLPHGGRRRRHLLVLRALPTARWAASTSTRRSSAWPTTPGGGGYWLVASDGGIFSYGDAAFYGSTGAIHLNKPIVGMAATPDGKGYWLVASDGGIFSYGDAAFYGSTGAIHLEQAHRRHGRHPRRQRLLAGGLRRRHLQLRRRRLLRLDGRPSTSTSPSSAWPPTADGHGYWLVASDGGIFSFGDAAFHGSRGHPRLNKPIVGMAATPDGAGLLAGGLRRRHLQLRRRRLQRIDGWTRARRADRGHGWNRRGHGLRDQALRFAGSAAVLAVLAQGLVIGTAPTNTGGRRGPPSQPGPSSVLR